MMKQGKAKLPIGRRVKYPGIRPLSRELGVTFGHLWKVLEGHRVGRFGLTDAYWGLVRERYGRVESAPAKRTAHYQIYWPFDFLKPKDGAGKCRMNGRAS